jgi:hypothetical protein
MTGKQTIFMGQQQCLLVLRGWSVDLRTMGLPIEIQVELERRC